MTPADREKLVEAYGRTHFTERPIHTDGERTRARAALLAAMEAVGEVYEVGMHDGPGYWYLGVKLSEGCRDFLGDSSAFTGHMGLRYGDRVRVSKVEAE